MSGTEPGHPAFLGALQDATSAMWDDLPDGVQDDYLKAAKKWSEDAPPKHIQSR